MKSLVRFISERQVIDFDKKISPNYGWCTILVGGSASGKSSIRSSKIFISGKTIDVDVMKDQYAALHKLKYDKGNPEDVRNIHAKVKDAGWKEKIVNNIIKGNTGKKKPNIIFDITGKKIEDITETAEIFHELDYKVKVIWILTDVNQAKSRNKQRARKVPEDILVQTHAGAYASMTKVINGEGIDDIDEISIVFNNDEDVKDNACDLEKTSNKWEIPSDYQEKYKEATKTLSKS
jgi:predicted kinase